LTPDTWLPLIQDINKSVGRLKEVVDVMLDVSQLDAETLDLDTSPTSLDLIVRVTADTWARALQERRLTLTMEGLEDLPSITADGDRLKQVFSQLIQNAIKSTPDDGQIRITARLLGAMMPPREQYVEVVVSDTGIGIPLDDLDRIFDKFYRVGDVMSHSTGETKFKGAGPGLGLTIARGIVEAHGGHIWAESPGYDETACPGSEFHVVLPVQPRLSASKT
jgi:signal transduction histidine kinase